MLNKRQEYLAININAETNVVISMFMLDNEYMRAMVHKCIVCQEPVRLCQEGLMCDGCVRLQHRTGILRSDYHIACPLGQIDWECTCAMFNSTRARRTKSVQH